MRVFSHEFMVKYAVTTYGFKIGAKVDAQKHEKQPYGQKQQNFGTEIIMSAFFFELIHFFLK